MTVEKNRAYGIVNGYEVSAYIKNLEYVDPLRIHIAFYASEEQTRKIDAAVNFNGYKRITRYGIYLGFKGFTMGGIATKLSEVFKVVFKALTKNGALGYGYCPVCGNATDNESESVRKCNIDGFAVTMEEKCVQALNAELAAMNAEFDKAPNNYGKGFVGAVIGGIAGGLVAVLFYLIGFVTSIAAVVAMFVGVLLYQKLGGKPNKMMILIVSVTALVCMFIAFFATYLVAARSKLNELGLASVSAFEGLAAALENAAFARMFYTDLSLMFGFSALGMGIMIFYFGRKFKRKKNIEE